tara:strand:+ start:1021 stop:1614 length:594 start_codon:yes stop_codon:yes gene_type:complete
MFAVVESGSITKYLNGNKGLKIGDIQYPSSIFTLWSESERNNIGIYTVEYDNSNKKDEKWYVNTSQSYAFADNKVTGTYGTATAKPHADTLFTAQDETDGFGTEGDVKTEGLKTQLIRAVKVEAKAILGETDWYVVRKADTDEAVPSSIATHRAAVRTKQASMETAITNASDTPALETLYTRNNSGVRPLGDLPRLI